MENTGFDLWHYTTAEGLKGILSDKTLWATDYRYLNDSTECSYAKSIISQEIMNDLFRNARFDPTSDIPEEDDTPGITLKETTDWIVDKLIFASPTPAIPFILSFCKMPKKNNNNLMDIVKTPENERFLGENGLLSQWRGYGKDGGYAVIFDSGELIKKFETEKYCDQEISIRGDVLYETDKLSEEMKTRLKKVSTFINAYWYWRNQSDKPRPDIDIELCDSLCRCMVLFKHKGFKEECEYRFCVMPLQERVKTRIKGGTLVPYIELFKNLPIKGICVGPHPEKDLRAKSIKAYLDSIELTKIYVFCSKIPYIGAK